MRASISVYNLTRKHGGVIAVDRLILEVEEESFGSLGPNYVGRTTAVYVPCGTSKPTWEIAVNMASRATER
jgi:ABC-type branched-subunit amino acid transport system ATPase component